MKDKDNRVEALREVLNECTPAKSERPRSLLNLLRKLERVGVDVGSEYRLEHPFAQHPSTTQRLRTATFTQR